MKSVYICNVSDQLENLQKRIYQLEEQLHSEMQLKDELDQKCRCVACVSHECRQVGTASPRDIYIPSSQDLKHQDREDHERTG